MQYLHAYLKWETMGISGILAIPMIITCLLQGTLCDMGIPRTFYGGNICSVQSKANFCGICFIIWKKWVETTVDEVTLNFLWGILWSCFSQSCSHKKRVDIFSSLLILERNPVYGTINWAKWNKNIHASDDVEELINFSAVVEFSAKLLKRKCI